MTFVMRTLAKWAAIDQLSQVFPERKIISNQLFLEIVISCRHHIETLRLSGTRRLVNTNQPLQECQGIKLSFQAPSSQRLVKEQHQAGKVGNTSQRRGEEQRTFKGLLHLKGI